MKTEKTKKEKRAPNDARTAWRNMTIEDRAEFIAWINDRETGGAR